MTEYYIGLGSNLGDREKMLREAVLALQRCDDITVKAVSSVYETPPWGKTDQESFLNAAMKIESNLDPEDTLQVCLAVEIALGRVRHEKWGARTIDVDLLCSPTVQKDTILLKLPHPYLTERSFVLIPLKEIEPELIIKGRPIDEWLQERPDVETIRKLPDIILWEGK
jgi:2-amino-4-hydroxy-6-hydroxymethyldihydropteridine diphosphokinase